MFSFLKNSLQKIYQQFTSKIEALFSRSTIDQATLKELELLLLSADTGVKTTRLIIESLTKQAQKGSLQKGSDLKQALEQELLRLLQTTKKAPADCAIYLLVGINGSGKTTLAGKLTHHFAQQGKKVLLVAADTFRAAAPAQLTAWAAKSNAQIVLGKEGQDPASVVFTGCEQLKKDNFDILIIDTAGRLQTKANLMKELEKIRKIMYRHMPDAPICTLLTIDAMLGQNSREQALLFHESTPLDGLVLTKMDGTGKGGIIFSIAHELGVPVAYITYGEQLDDIKKFDSAAYVKELLSKA